MNVNNFAHYAENPAVTRGRLHAEGPSAYRTAFQRDRDRIIHSSAFRRLKHKTQVFMEHEGDYFRTRLTHTLEVAQAARTIAGVLRLNGDLTETIALAHDLGHPPFGHTGEDTLDALMQPVGGFDHNAQALRIVTDLERHYAQFNGLNLCWETLEGMAKHNGPIIGSVPPSLAEYSNLHDLELGSFASAEAQVAALADDIAYNNHDIQDGLRAGLFREGDLANLPIVGAAFADVDRAFPDLDTHRRLHEASRRIFGAMVEDVIETSTKILTDTNPQSAQDVRELPHAVIRFSDETWGDIKQIRQFLFKHMYRAPSVIAQRETAAKIVETLFDDYMNNPSLLPAPWQNDVQTGHMMRNVGDYIAGMTDRFALQEYSRLHAAD